MSSKKWAPIPGYPGYEASTDGEIKNTKTGHITKGGNAGEYLKVSVYAKGDDKPKLCYVHDLVCRAFHGACGKNQVVLHKDDNKKNNKSSNLKKGTQSQNIQSAYDNGLICKESKTFGDIVYRPVKKSESDQINLLLHEASEDPFLDNVEYRDNHKVIGFYYDGHLAGFCIPRRENNHWRLGPIYVKPQYRGKGIASGFIKEFYKDKMGRAYIEPHNKSSRNAYLKSGFRETGKTLRGKDGTLYLQYQKDVVNPIFFW